jgi:excisionase family DNA binding protein
MAAPAAENEPIVAQPFDKAAFERLRTMMASDDACALKLLDAEGGVVELPSTVLQVLRRAVDALARDRIVRVTSMGRDLTLYEAADLLNVPVTHVRRLIDEGRLPSTLMHDLQRVPFDALMTFKAEDDARRDGALDELTRLSQEFGLYDMPE